MFKEHFTKEKVFIEDLLKDSYKEIEEYYEMDYEIRKMILAYYYQRDMRNYYKNIIKKAEKILNLDELYAIIISKFINTENRKYCPVKQWENILTIVYSKNREKIVKYL